MNERAFDTPITLNNVVLKDSFASYAKEAAAQ